MIYFYHISFTFELFDKVGVHIFCRWCWLTFFPANQQSDTILNMYSYARQEKFKSSSYRNDISYMRHVYQKIINSPFNLIFYFTQNENNRLYFRIKCELYQRGSQKKKKVKEWSPFDGIHQAFTTIIPCFYHTNDKMKIVVKNKQTNKH